MSEKPDAVEEKIVSMLDALQNGVTELGGKAVKYAPDVADAALWIVRIDGIQNVVISLFLIATGIFFLKKVRGLWKIAEDSDLEPLYFAPIGSAMYGFGAVVIGSIRIVDLWPWVAIFEPKLALAKQIVDSVLK